MKGICLVSGGLDSSLALIKLVRSNIETVPMFVDYGQYSVEKERNALYKLNNILNCRDSLLPMEEITLEMSTPNLRKVGSAWGRGIALVGIAAMWAYVNGDDFDFIALGNHKGDVGPDCKPGEFNFLLEKALLESTKKKLRISLPIVEYTQEEIALALDQEGFRLEVFYNCYWDPPCGFKSPNEEYRCPGCRRKMKAYEVLGKPNTNPNFDSYSYQRDSRC